MSTKIISIKKLFPGQEVSLANCATTGKVISRTGKGLYQVEYKGRICEMNRVQLGVKYLGRFVYGAVNTDDFTIL